jgi:hypothetical protein
MPQVSSKARLSPRACVASWRRPDMMPDQQPSTKHGGDVPATNASVFTICSRQHLVANGGMHRNVGQVARGSSRIVNEGWRRLDWRGGSSQAPRPHPGLVDRSGQVGQAQVQRQGAERARLDGDIDRASLACERGGVVGQPAITFRTATKGRLWQARAHATPQTNRRAAGTWAGRVGPRSGPYGEAGPGTSSTSWSSLYLATGAGSRSPQPCRWDETLRVEAGVSSVQPGGVLGQGG